MTSDREEKIDALINALEKLIDITYTAAIEEGNRDVQMARIHARAAIDFARPGRRL